MSLDKAICFQGGELISHASLRHFTIVSQCLVAGETAVVRIMAIGQMKQHNLGRRLNAALLDSPTCGDVAHRFSSSVIGA